jgi:type I restriction enzyme S subunit
MTEPPVSWEECSLGDIVDYGSTVKVEPDDIPLDAWVLELEDIEKDSSRVLKRITFAERQSKSTKNKFDKGDVLYGKLRPYLNKTILADQRGYCTTEIVPIKSSSSVDTGYLFYWLKSPVFLNYVNSVSHGLNMPRLGTDAGRKAPFFLPPLAEQRRIVAKLETLLGKVSSSQQRLARIPGLLKRFRQSVLAAACSGKLTADWRAESCVKEDATELLKLIAARRQRENAEEVRLAAMAGIRKPRQIRLSQIPDIEIDAANIPGNWAQTNIEFVGHVTKLAGFEYTQHIQLCDNGDVSVVRAQNVQMGRFVNENIKFISSDISNLLERSQLRGREVLMVFIGAGTGNVCMAPAEGKWHLAPNVAKIDVDGFDAKYICLYLQSPIGFAQTFSLIKATAQQSLSMETIRQIRVNIAPLAEQQEIVRRVDKLFAFADRIEARLQQAQSHVDRLTQSILAKAFRGELVPTEAELARREGRSYETASELLDRIRVAKSDAQPTKPKKQKK